MQNIIGYCADSIPKVLGLFDFSVAPSLLFYAYLPIVIVTVIIGGLIFFHDRFSRISISLATLISFFVLWVANIIVQWVAVPNWLINFSWQLTAFFEIGIFVSSLALLHAFIHKEKRVSRRFTASVFVLMTLVLILTFTPYNISAYDYENCEGQVGILWLVIYIFEVLSSVMVFIYGLYTAKKSMNISEKKQRVLFSVGLSLFMLIFALSNIYGEIYQKYEINLIGPIGMALFVCLITYLIVKYKSFDIKLFGVQALVYGLFVLIFSLLLVNSLQLIHVIIGITFVFVIFVGISLIRGVKKEIAQKERLEKLTEALEESNTKLGVANDRLKDLDKLKTEFLSLASHQLRSPLTAIKGYTSMLLEGDFGVIGEKQKEAIDRVFQSSIHLAKVVEDLLNVSKIEQGGMKYEMAPFDFEKVAHDLATDLSVTAEKKGLKLVFETDSKPPYMVNGDAEKIRQVVLNIIDNSIKYTETGSITVSLKKHVAGKVIRLDVTDTGMGISAEEKEKLFQKFGRGAGGKTNTGGSGLGLYLAKQIAEAHGGNISIDSPGVGKGSIFSIELKEI